MPNQAILDFVKSAARRKHADRPAITLAYAQSIDGSISLKSGQPMLISGSDSLTLTHQLRAVHDAILVGIGTILADDPQLSVRLIEGPSPQPLVLDSRLRFPLDSKLLSGDKKPWVFCSTEVDQSKVQTLESRGAKIFPLDVAEGGGLDLVSFLKFLTEHQINSVMLEGGASLIASFLGYGMVDKAIITIAPSFIGGLKVVAEPLSKNVEGPFPRIHSPKTAMLGDDLVLWGAVA